MRVHARAPFLDTHTHTHTHTASRTDPSSPARPQILDDYKIQSSAGRGRVSRLRVRVTDVSGAPVGGAAVTYKWTSVPGDGSGVAAFAPIEATVRTSGSKSSTRRGIVTLTSPKASSGWVRLDLLRVEAPAGWVAPSPELNMAASDVQRDFVVSGVRRLA